NTTMMLIQQQGVACHTTKEIEMSNEQYKALEQEMETVLEKIFEAGTELYEDRGFKRRVGYGTRPAVIHIDIANAWTRPGHSFSCENMDTIIPACQDQIGRASSSERDQIAAE